MKKTHHFFLLFGVFTLLLIACDPEGSTSNDSSTTTTKAQITEPISPPATPSNVPKPDSTPDIVELEQKAQTMSTTAFNQEVASAREKGESWTGSPITVALRFAGEGFDSRQKSIDVESLSGGEVFNKVLVRISEDGFLDDSIRGSMVILRMEQDNGYWKINSAKKVWKCWENRGHTAFNSEPCH